MTIAIADLCLSSKYFQGFAKEKRKKKANWVFGGLFVCVCVCLFLTQGS